MSATCTTLRYRICLYLAASVIFGAGLMYPNRHTAVHGGAASAKAAQNFESNGNDQPDPAIPGNIASSESTEPMPLALPHPTPPQFSVGMIVQIRDRINSRYGILFGALNLSPPKQEALTNLILTRQLMIVSDTLRKARGDARDVPVDLGVRVDPDGAIHYRSTAVTVGLSPGYAAVVAEAVAPAEAEIKSLLGTSDYAKYGHYRDTLPNRTVINDSLQLSLQKANLAVLDSVQVERLIGLMMEANPSQVTSIPRFSNSTLMQAKEFLTDGQMIILTEVAESFASDAEKIAATIAAASGN